MSFETIDEILEGLNQELEKLKNLEKKHNDVIKSSFMKQYIILWCEKYILSPSLMKETSDLFREMEFREIKGLEQSNKKFLTDRLGEMEFTALKETLQKKVAEIKLPLTQPQSTIQQQPKPIKRIPTSPFNEKINVFEDEVQSILKNIKEIYENKDQHGSHESYSTLTSLENKLLEIANEMHSTYKENADSLENYVEENHKVHYGFKMVNIAIGKIDALKRLSSPEANKKELESIYINLQKNEDFLAGRAENLLQSSVEASLVFGPLIKNDATREYEALVKALIRSEKEPIIKKNFRDQQIMLVEGKEYNLSTIIKSLNLTHVELDKADSDAFLSMLSKKPIYYKPDPDPTAPGADAYAQAKNRAKSEIRAIEDNRYLSISEKEKKISKIQYDLNNMVDKIILQTVDEDNQSLPKEQQDTRLKNIESGQRLGLNIWSTGFYANAVPLFRNHNIEEAVSGEMEAFTKKHGAASSLREILCTMAFVANGGSFIPENLENLSTVKPVELQKEEIKYRGDDNLPENILSKRVELAQSGGIYSSNTPTSTSEQAPLVDFAFKEDSTVKVGSIHTEVFGINIGAASRYRYEREFLSLSPQKQVEAVSKTGDNQYVFQVRDVAVLNDLTIEQRQHRHDAFLNETAFWHAGVYAHKNYLATPYLSGSSDYQKYAERAICLLKNGEIVDLSFQNAVDYMDIETGEVNTQKIERDFGSKVEKIIHRPNHELLHSLRQAAHIPAIKDFLDHHAPTKEYNALEAKHLERLQVMMVFCVTGRLDETGFHDSEEARERYYKEYRKVSAKAFMEYIQNERPDLYEGEPLEALYHDAWMVEIMGAPGVPTDEDRDNSNYYMIDLMRKHQIPMPSRTEIFPRVYVDMMNIAHSLDLLRVYPPKSNDAANSEKNISLLLSKSFNFLKGKKGENGKNALTEENMLCVIKDTIGMLQYSRRMLDESGDKNTTMVEMDEKKINALMQSNELRQLIKSIENSNNSDHIRNTYLKISSVVGDAIFKEGAYEYDAKRFDHCHYKNNSVKEEDRDFEKDVTSGMKMINEVKRPIFSNFIEASRTTEEKLPPISVQSGSPRQKELDELRNSIDSMLLNIKNISHHEGENREKCKKQFQKLNNYLAQESEVTKDWMRKNESRILYWRNNEIQSYEVRLSQEGLAREEQQKNIKSILEKYTTSSIEKRYHNASKLGKGFSQHFNIFQNAKRIGVDGQINGLQSDISAVVNAKNFEDMEQKISNLKVRIGKLKDTLSEEEKTNVFESRLSKIVNALERDLGLTQSIKPLPFEIQQFSSICKEVIKDHRDKAILVKNTVKFNAQLKEIRKAEDAINAFSNTGNINVFKDQLQQCQDKKLKKELEKYADTFERHIEKTKMKKN